MSGASSCTNITREGQRRRRLSGWVALAAGAIVVAGLAARGAPAAAFVVVFPFAFGAALGLLQARAMTCVMLGFRNAAEVEGGGFRRVTGAARDEARRQARTIVWQSIGIAALVTGVAVITAAGI